MNIKKWIKDTNKKWLFNIIILVVAIGIKLPQGIQSPKSPEIRTFKKVYIHISKGTEHSATVSNTKPVPVPTLQDTTTLFEMSETS